MVEDQRLVRAGLAVDRDRVRVRRRRGAAGCGHCAEHELVAGDDERRRLRAARDRRGDGLRPRVVDAGLSLRGRRGSGRAQPRRREPSQEERERRERPLAAGSSKKGSERLSTYGTSRPGSREMPTPRWRRGVGITWFEGAGSVVPVELLPVPVAPVVIRLVPVPACTVVVAVADVRDALVVVLLERDRPRLDLVLLRGGE